MMDVFSNLTAIGFTEYEARVYLALLRDHPATGYQLSKDAGVPRSMVYEALGRLSIRGAVLKTEEKRATLYRPLPPQVLLDRYNSEHQQLIQELHEELGNLYDKTGEDHIWVINGRNSVLSYAAQMLQSAQTEALLVLADAELDALQPEIITASARGVQINALLSGEKDLEVGMVLHHAADENRLQSLGDLLLLAVDNRETLIAQTSPDLSATITSNHNLVMIARQFVWMELFTQHLYTLLGSYDLSQIFPNDREFLERFSPRRAS